MKKLLLTSNGFGNPTIATQFLELLTKPLSQVKIIFIPTAARTKEELKYVDQSKQELYCLGINPKNLMILNINHHFTYNDFKSYDVMYICGGNTFYLLTQIKKYHFDKTIKQFLNEGKLYVGVSAGSIIVGPSIEIVVPFYENDSYITNFDGLNIIDKVLSPHYTTQEETLIKKYRTKFKILPLKDNQALLIIGNKEKIIKKYLIKFPQPF